MAEVHVEIPDRYVREVRDALGRIRGDAGRTGEAAVTAQEIFAEALAVYRWVVAQTSEGRAVVATADYKRILTQVETAFIPAIDPHDWKPQPTSESAAGEGGAAK